MSDGLRDLVKAATPRYRDPGLAGTVRWFHPGERCFVNGYEVEILRQARRTTFARVVDVRLPGRVTVQLGRHTPALLARVDALTEGAKG